MTPCSRRSQPFDDGLMSLLAHGWPARTIGENEHQPADATWGLGQAEGRAGGLTSTTGAGSAPGASQLERTKQVSTGLTPTDPGMACPTSSSRPSGTSTGSTGALGQDLFSEDVGVAGMLGEFS